MHKIRTFRQLELASLLALAWLPLPCRAGELGAVAQPDGNPVITTAQIEADWLRQAVVRSLPSLGTQITTQQDAAGGCDGVIDGHFGFHTQQEENPWWQVDLGQSLPLDRIVIYNRGDGVAERAAHLQVLVSDDGQDWQLLYEHDGSVFSAIRRSEASAGRGERLPGALRANSVARHELPPPGRGGGLSRRQSGKRGLAETGRSVQCQSLVVVDVPPNAGLPAAELSRGGSGRAWTPAGRRPECAGRRRSGLHDFAADDRRRSPRRCRATTRPSSNVRCSWRPLGHSTLGAEQSAAGFRRPAAGQARARLVHAHVGPVLRLVLAAGRRSVRAGRLQDGQLRNCGA